MKTWILSAALAVSVLLNVGFFWKLSQKPADAKTPVLDAVFDPNEDQAVESARELSFLRDLLERWSSFQSSTYLQSQVNLLPMLSPSLAEERKKEIQRLSKKMREQSVEQEAHLTSLFQDDEGRFHASLQLRLNEENKKTGLRLSQKIATEKDIPSLENAWGFRATSLTSELQETSDRTEAISLQAGRPAILSFPCAVRGVSDLNTGMVKFKLVTMKKSELILNAQKTWPGSIPLQVDCEQSVFKFQLQTATPSLRFYAVDISEGKAPPVAKNRRNDPNRVLIQRSLERELGFQIEDSDNH